MSRWRETFCWVIIVIMIILSANSYIKSGGNSINAWALLLLIPIPISLIVSERSKETKMEENLLDDWEDSNEQFSPLAKQADEPLDSGFDVPIV
jgi:Zn-dependent membrane protease YugP